MPENSEDFDQYVGMANELYAEHIEGPRIREQEQQELMDHITRLNEINSVVATSSGSKLVVPGLDTSRESLSEEDLGMIYEQEHLQFLIDHHLFYWKMDRYMLTVDQRPLPAQIAQDRYLAHGARQNLLELWKKKELNEKRNLSQKDA